MTTRMLIVTASTLLAVGCAQTPGPLGLQNCKSPKIPKACNGNPNSPKVNVNRSSLNFSPRNVCAAPGSVIVFTLTPDSAYELGDTLIVPKDPADTWLSGNNSDEKDEIRIPVPPTVSKGPHEYGAVFDNGDCIDPRVEVTE